MSEVISFLEQTGRDALLRNATREALASRLQNTTLDADIRAAILAGDRDGLDALLGCRGLCCMISPGREDEDGDEDGPDEPATPDESRRACAR